jgi:hypothetical protein
LEAKAPAAGSSAECTCGPAELKVFRIYYEDDAPDETPPDPCARCGGSRGAVLLHVVYEPRQTKARAL